MGRKYTKELLEEAAANSTSVAGILRYLGLRQAGGTQAHIGRMLKKLEVDTSHFTQRRLPPTRPPLTAAQILVRKPRDANRTKPEQLRRALNEIGRPYVCEMCGCDGNWQGHAISLHVDHIDGDMTNNVPENVRYLCPNCHSTTETFAGRQKGRYTSA
ncbi:HNH endonuclease signature motif containing protein [Janibacter indicus]